VFVARFMFVLSAWSRRLGALVTGSSSEAPRTTEYACNPPRAAPFHAPKIRHIAWGGKNSEIRE